MVAILSIVFMDATTPINCQVSLFSVTVYSRVFTGRNFKLWIVFERVSTAFVYSRGNVHQLTTVSLSSDIRLSVLGCCFTIDRSSRVRPRSYFCCMIISPNLALIGAVSVAIWNKHRIAMGMAIGIWGINVVLHIQGESPPPIVFGTDNICDHTTAVW